LLSQEIPTWTRPHAHYGSPTIVSACSRERIKASQEPLGLHKLVDQELTLATVFVHVLFVADILSPSLLRLCAELRVSPCETYGGAVGGGACCLPMTTLSLATACRTIERCMPSKRHGGGGGGAASHSPHFERSPAPGLHMYSTYPHIHMHISRTTAQPNTIQKRLFSLSRALAPSASAYLTKPKSPRNAS
jgi:hypothetical protein